MENSPLYEEELQPDLLQAFHDQEVTLFGRTGTIGDLAGMCPVDLNDPSISLESKNVFVVKAVNEAGLEIDEKYESIFTKVVEEQGLTTNFSIARPSEHQPDTKQPEPVSEKLRREALASREAEEVKQPDLLAAIKQDSLATSRLDEIRLHLEAIETEEAEPALEKLRHSELEPPIRQDQDVARPRSAKEAVVVKPETSHPKKVETVLSKITSKVSPKPKATKLVEVKSPIINESQTKPVPSEASLVAETHLAKDKVEPLLSPVELDEPEVGSLVPDFAPLEFNQEAKLAPQGLHEEAMGENYDVFVASLEEVITQLELAIDPENILETELNFSMAEAEELIVFKPVLEALVSLSDEELIEVEPLLAEIMEQVEFIGLIEAGELDSEELLVAEQALEMACQNLLDLLGIDYEELEVKQFVNLIKLIKLTKNLELSKPAINLDLGTHEVKLRSYSLVKAIDYLKQQTKRRIGALALSYPNQLGLS